MVLVNFLRAKAIWFTPALDNPACLENHWIVSRHEDGDLGGPDGSHEVGAAAEDLFSLVTE